MLTLAHGGQPLAPHDLWWAWNVSPPLLLGLAGAAWAYRRGHATWGSRWAAGGLASIGIALVSPLDALSGALASAHMVQHVLLVLVAAPLLALSAPFRALVRGAPRAVRRSFGRWRARLRPAARGLQALRHPASAWLLHAGTLWFWHAAVPYEAALDNAFVHALEHGSFLATALLFWHAVVGARAGHGWGVLLVFGMALQSALLATLLTFARAPWYSPYATTTRAWGLEPLADQQLAGAIMWVPAGLIYLGAALALLFAWIRASEREDLAL